MKKIYTQESILRREGCYLLRKGKRPMLGVLKCILNGGVAAVDMENNAIGLHDVFHKHTINSINGFC